MSTSYTQLKGRCEAQQDLIDKMYTLLEHIQYCSEEERNGVIKTMLDRNQLRSEQIKNMEMKLELGEVE